MATAVGWLPWALLSAIFAALTALFAKVGVKDVNPEYATFIRTIVIALFAGVVLIATGGLRSDAAISNRTALFLLLSGLATGASWLCYFRALSLGPVAAVAPVEKLSVVLAAVLGVLVLREHVGMRGWCGIALITAGVALIASKPA